MKHIHGCLIQWMGRGVLLVGDSGAGKTTCALEIVRRGGVWVADDLVELSIGDDRRPLGKAHERIRGLAWLPSKGIFAVTRMFPSFHTIPECRINFIVELIKKNENTTEKYITVGEIWKSMDLRVVFLSVMVDDDVRNNVPRIIRRLRCREGSKEG